MPCYQVKNLQMKGVVLPWGSVCAVFQDSSEFQKSSISTMSDTYVLVRLLVIVNCMKQSIRSNFALWGEVFDIVHCWCHDNFKHSCKMLALGVIKSKGLYNISCNIWYMRKRRYPPFKCDRLPIARIGVSLQECLSDKTRCWGLKMMTLLLSAGRSSWKRESRESFCIHVSTNGMIFIRHEGVLSVSTLVNCYREA